METEEIILRNDDLMAMSLLHFFMTEEDYNPIILNGLEDEIWLENLEKPYRVVRIIKHYIHNNEQLSFDRFKLGRIVKQIKKKTFSLKLKVLNIYTNLGDNVKLNSDDSVFVKKIEDLNNPILLKVYPDIIDKANHEEKGIDLFVKITNDINVNNKKKYLEADEVFAKKDPIVTKIIMTICFLVFLSMYVFGAGSTDNLTLINFGANFDLLTKSGEYYRLFTCAFIHIGLFHLLVNMYALYIIGSQVEGFFGKWKYILIYCVSAISGSLLSMSFSTNVISAGASGAIFGLLGAMLYVGYYYRAYLGNVLMSQIIPIIIINLVFGFVLSGIDNFAHIGGLIGGVLCGMSVGFSKKDDNTNRINNIIVCILYLAFIVYLAFR